MRNKPIRFQTVEVTCLRTMAKSYKIYETIRGSRLMDRQPVAAGIPTREEAVAMLRELEAAVEAKLEVKS